MRSPSTSSSRTSPSSTTGCAAGASTSTSDACRGSRWPRRSSRFQRAGVEPEALERGGSQLSLELVLTAHPTEAARRTVLAAQLRLSRLLAELDDPRSHRRAGDGVEARARRGDHARSGRRTRCARAARASSTRSATGCGSSSRACSTRREHAARRLPRALPGAPCTAALRHAGSAATRTAIPRPGPTRSPRRSSRRARWRSRATATRCASSRARSASRRARRRCARS